MTAAATPEPSPDSGPALQAPATAPAEAVVPPSPIGGFWRRAAAFVIDMLLLGGVGMALGAVAFDALAALGAWGRVVGFAVAWPYFGLMASRLGGGQTVGKRLCGLRVRGVDGAALSPARGLLRATVLMLPWLLNSLLSDPELLDHPVPLLLTSMLVIGGALVLIYLAAFNRPSRRSLHDWVAGSVVLRADATGPTLPLPLWRGHAVALAGLALLSLAVPIAVRQAAAGAEAATLLAMRATVLAEAGVQQAGVTQGWSVVKSTQGADRRTTYVAVQARVSADGRDSQKALADRLGRTLAARHAEPLQRVDQLVVTVAYGYDIGIASGWRSTRLSGPWAQWQAEGGR